MSVPARRVPDSELLAPGHRACPGCGTAIATRLILRATGPRVIVVTATGCLETFTSPYGLSAWEVPWIHSLLENAAAVASGVAAALRYQGRRDVKVLAIGGDGGTFDIGFASLSGMLERGDDVLYICYDNEAYMNTGFQRSAATPYGASTTTTPAGQCSLGKAEPKKDMPAIAAAHGISYVATASIAFPQDLMNKVKKALDMPGARYLQVHCPCTIGWGFDPSQTIRVARAAVDCGLVALWEQEKGQPRRVRKVGRRRPVEEYLKMQNRFAHLFTSPEGARVVAEIQAAADAAAAELGL